MKCKLCDNKAFVSGFCKDCLRKYDTLALGFPDKQVCLFCDTVIEGSRRRCDLHKNKIVLSDINYRLHFFDEITNPTQTAFGADSRLKYYEEKIDFFNDIELVGSKEEIAIAKLAILRHIGVQLLDGINATDMIERRVKALKELRKNILTK